MVSLIVDRSRSLNYDYRSPHPTLTPSPWQHHEDARKVRSRFSYVGQRDYSRSPSRTLPSSSRYGLDRNLSLKGGSSNFHDNFSSSRSRDMSRRFSTAGLFSSVVTPSDRSFSESRDYSASPLLTMSSRRSYAQSSGLKTSQDFLDKYSSPSSVNSDVFLPSYSSRSSYLPSTVSGYLRTYGGGLGSSGIYSNDYKRRSYVASIPSLHRQHSYHEFNLSPSRTPSSYLSGHRSRSMSRFSYPRHTSVEPIQDVYASKITSSEPIQGRLMKVLNKYSSDVYENRSILDSPNYKRWGKIDFDKDDILADIQRFKSGAYDVPKRSRQEIFNEIQSNRDWLPNDGYSRRPTRLWHSINGPSIDNLKVPDTMDSLLHNISKKTTPRSSIAPPEIRIENEDLKSEPLVTDDSIAKDVESLMEERGNMDISNKDLSRLLKTNNPEELTRLVLDAGESFRPNEISTAILPTGEKALIMTQTRQTSVADDGSRRKSVSPSPQASAAFLTPTYEPNLPPSYQEQEWANEEIDKFTQLTEEYEESLQTLEHFIARNRCLFPENLIIYQKIVYYKSSAGELISQNLSTPKRFSFAEDTDICAVKVREKLVLPHECRKNGYDVLSMLKRCYPRYDEVEVVYDDEENIKEKLLRQEHGKLNPFDDDFDHPTKSYDDGTINANDANELNSEEDELLERCRRDEECIPYFVTKPKNQTCMSGQSIRYTCSVAGNPEPEVFWYKNGLPIPKDDRFLASNNYGICSLRINSVRPDDKGAYTVEIENTIGSVVADVRLDILSTELNPLTSNLAFTKTPPYYVHMTEGDPLTLRCILQGEKRPKVTWYKGSREISAGDKYRMVAENDWQHMMQIRKLEFSDGGLYTVLADDGISSVRHSIEVNVAPKRDIDDTTTEYEIVRKMGHIKMPPTFVKELPLQHRMKEGSSLLIGCEVDESDSQAYVMGVEIVERKKSRSKEPERSGMPDLASPLADSVFMETIK